MPNWDELKTLIEEEARKLNLDQEEEGWGVPTQNSLTQNNENAPWWLQSAKEARHRHDFIGVPPDRFVETAYLTILGRAPDPSGEASYGPWCTTWIGRVALLSVLSESHEANNRIAGTFFWRKLFALSRRIPGNSRWIALLDGWLRWLDKGAANRALWQHLHEHSGQLVNQQALLNTQQTLLSDQQQQQTELAQQFQGLEKGLEAAHRQMNKLLSATGPQTNQEHNAATDDFYLAFENACRGEESDIRERLEVYLPFLDRTRNSPAVDLGCGRGEWLHLLKEQGFDTMGVELNTSMVEQCREQGIQVVVSDDITWLKHQPKNHLGTVTAFHLLEHLPFHRLLELVQEAHRTLKTGGVAIFETPNPENLLVGAHTFYHDPTHRNPLTPALLEFVLQYAGFEQVEILRLNPYPSEALVPGDGTIVERLNGHFYGPQDFAVVGTK